MAKVAVEGFESPDMKQLTERVARAVSEGFQNAADDAHATQAAIDRANNRINSDPAPQKYMIDDGKLSTVKNYDKMLNNLYKQRPEAANLNAANSNETTDTRVVQLAPVSIEALADAVTLKRFEDVGRDLTQSHVDGMQDSIDKLLEERVTLMPVDPTIVAKSIDTLREHTDKGLSNVTNELLGVQTNTMVLPSIEEMTKDQSEDISTMLSFNEAMDSRLENIKTLAEDSNSIERTLVDVTKQVVKAMATTNKRITEDAKNQLEWFNWEKERAEASMAGDRMGLKKDVKEMTWMEYFKHLNDAFKGQKLEDDKMLEKTLRAIGQTTSFFGAIGSFLGSGAGSILVRILPGLGAAVVPALSAVAAIGAFVGTLALISESTNYLTRYGEVFVDLWNNQIYPGMSYLLTTVGEAVARLTSDFIEWWNQPGNTFKIMGQFLNEVLLHLLGSELPMVLDAIGSVVKSFFKFIEDTYNAIVGAAGIGPDKDKDPIELLWKVYRAPFDLFYGVVHGISDAITVWIKENVTLDNIKALIESPMGQILPAVILYNWVDRIGTAIASTINNIADTIGDALNQLYEDFKALNIGDIIVNKIWELYEWITSMIPSTDDLKQMMISALKANPLTGPSAWLMDQLGVFDSAPPEEYSRFTESSVGKPAPNVIINNAPVTATTNNNSSAPRQRYRAAPTTRPERSGYDERLLGAPAR